MSREVIPVAIAVVFDAAGCVLIAKRPFHVHLGGYWEFPGGKIESGESALQALKRELKEEVGITINDAQKLMEFTHSYEENDISFVVWCVKDFHGEAKGCEGQSIRWVPMEALSTVDFPQVNQKIIERLLVSSTE